MLKMIKTQDDYEKALNEVESLIDLTPQMGTDNGDRLELLTFLISKYEDEQFPLEHPDPIEAIKFRMEQQGLSYRDLIPFIGSRSKVSEVLNRKRQLSLKMIRALHKGLGIPADVLLQAPNGSLPSEIKGINWLKFPINDMIKRKWFVGFEGTLSEAKDRAEELIRGLFQGLDIESLEHQLYRQNVRTGSEMDKYALLAWQAKVLQIAQKKSLQNKYRPGTVTQSFLTELVKLSYLQDGPILAKEYLNKNGIEMIILSHLPRTHLDGAAMLLSDGTPVVALTLRYDRIDNFWFSLCHELAHVSLHLSDKMYDCFLDDLDATGNDLEEQADELARDSLIAPEIWRTLNKFTSQTVYDFAQKIRIHPAIIVGRIHYENKNYHRLSRLVGHGEVRKLFAKWL